MTSRFNQVKDYMAALTSWAIVTSEDSSLVVDTGEVEIQSDYYSAKLDELLAIPPIPENREAISRSIANLWAAADGVEGVCRDLIGPLERLMESVGGDEDDDDDGSQAADADENDR